MTEQTLQRPALPPYSGPMGTCAKCGGHDAETAYTAGVSCVHQNDGQHEVVRSDSHEYDEWLHRRCNRCGYQWDEAVKADRETQAPAGD